MAFSSVISLANAIARGHQHWKIVLTNWGNVQTNADTESRGYQIQRPVLGVQIASESLVGECLVSFNAGQTIATLNDIGLTERQLYVRRGRPYFWRTPAALTFNATDQSKWGDAYYPSVAANPTVTAAFGGLLPVSQFLTPELRLIVFLEHVPPIISEPSKPFEDTDIRTLSINDTAEHLLHFYPIQHREAIRVTVENEDATDPVEVRFTGLRGIAHHLPAVDNDHREFELFSTPIVVPPLTRVCQPISTPAANFLGLYATKQINNGASDLNWSVWAD